METSRDVAAIMSNEMTDGYIKIGSLEVVNGWDDVKERDVG